MNRLLLATAATVTALAVAAVAIAGDRPARRTTFKVVPTTRVLGAPTGSTQTIEYLGDASRGGKPHPVRKVVIRFPRGTRIDTAVPVRCRASDEELQAQGEDACPPRSRLGEGKVTAITGFGPPADPIKLDMTLFNMAQGVILLAKAEGSDQTANVTRARLRGRTLTTEVAPTPGGPPDGQSALKDVRLTTFKVFRRRNGERRTYARNPRRCPSSGRLVTRATFTYADGYSETIRSGVACAQAR